MALVARRDTFMAFKHFKTFQAVLCVLGIVLLTWIIVKIGPLQILENFQTLSWRLLLIIALASISYMFHTLGWLQYFKANNKDISFWKLFKIKIAGEATNTLTPLSFVGGDPVRAILLHNSDPSLGSGASVVVDRTVYVISTILLITLGLIMGFMRLSIPSEIRMTLLFIIVLLIVGLYLLIHHQRGGFFISMLNLAKKMRIKKDFTEKTLEKCHALDTSIKTFYMSNKRRFLLSIFLQFLGRLEGVLEVFLLSYFLGIPMDFWTAFFLTALFPLLNFAFGIIPGNVGVLEGATGIAFHLLKLGVADGGTLQLCRRIRSVFWILVGLIIMARHDQD